jgi:hypothetical protein
VNNVFHGNGELTVPNFIISQSGRLRCRKYLIPSVFSESLEILVKHISSNDKIDSELAETVKFFLGIVQSCSKLVVAIFHQKLKGKSERMLLPDQLHANWIPHHE